MNLQRPQALLLYPKIFPPIFSKKLPSQAAKFPKGCTVQLSPIQSKLGFESDQEKEVFKGPIKSHMLTNMVKHPHIKFQGIQLKIAQSKS